MATAGQCRVNPPTGVAGAIYSAWTTDADAGLASGVTTSGSTRRKLIGAQIEAIAASIASVAPTLTQSAQAANFTAAGGNHYRCDATTGNIVVTLPGASSNTGAILTIKKIDASANTVSVTRAGGDLIDGATNVILGAQWAHVMLVGHSSGWDVI